MSTGETSGKPKVALIAGPTASGKSALAVQLAQQLELVGHRAVVLNADSAQVYADLSVLSARPSQEETGGVEHRLFGVWDGATACSAADWASAAKSEIEGLHAEDALPILVGGTGLYLRTLLDGIAPVPSIDPTVRAAIRALSLTEARQALEVADPVAAARLAPADVARTMRALEVVRSTGRTLAAWQAERHGGIADAIELHAAALMPERESLYVRCDQRFESMLEGGAVPEVEALLARGLENSLPVMRAIGVREIALMLKGQLSRAETLLAGQIATRQYAKRQYTWFRHQPPNTWLRANSENCYDRVIDAFLFHYES